ncbi:MAG: Tetracycline resistance protein, class C [Chlamydiales bacterium]|nr:Tetracycline resistance protein, class C [Chlamydiales bacterium]
MVSKNKAFTLLSLMFVLFLDGLGQGIVFPIYSKTLFDPHSHLLAATTSPAMRNIWYGILVGAFFFCWFVGAAILSDLSDKGGRKKILIICLSGSAIGNILSALGFTFQNIWLLLLGRIVVGITNGGQPIAQASIVDTSPKEKLSRNLGLIVMAVSLGIIGGPLVGGFLSNSALVSWFKESTPLYLAGILALFNILLLLVFYHETSKVCVKIKIRLTRAIDIFVSAFKHKSVRFLSTCFLLLQTGWAIYFVYISAYMVQNYSLTRNEIAIFFALVGLGLVIGLAFLSSLFEKWIKERKFVVFIGYGLLLLSLVISTFPNNPLWAWLMTIPIGAGMGLGYSFILALFSQQVTADRQGWVMGITSALVAFGAGAASIIEGFLSPLNLRLPFYISIALIAIGLLVFCTFKSSHESPSKV